MVGIRTLPVLNWDIWVTSMMMKQGLTIILLKKALMYTNIQGMLMK